MLDTGWIAVIVLCCIFGTSLLTLLSIYIHTRYCMQPGPLSPWPPRTEDDYVEFA